MRVAFLDRDGTIIKDYPDEYWARVNNPEFIDGAIEGLRYIREKGYEIIIITNQYIINDGIITLNQYREITDKLLKILDTNGIKVMDIFFCPHSMDEGCDCCKPKTGLIDMTLEKYPEIDMGRSFIMGDSLCDIELGNSVGIKTFGINIKDKNIDSILLKSIIEIKKYL